ncbi:MAG: hypothetical protein HDQ88_06435 [Clostridia bacterium]|nr:hypothetical protein [Clostridia bacterium]
MDKPLKLELRTLYGNMPEDQRYVQDIYESLEQARSDHRYDLIVVGYCIVNSETKKIHPDTREWYETYHEAEKDMVDILKATNPPPELHAMIRKIENGNEIVDTLHVTFRATSTDIYTEERLKECVMAALDRCIKSEKLQAPLDWDDAVKLLVKYPSTCTINSFECVVSASSSLYHVSSSDACDLT